MPLWSSPVAHNEVEEQAGAERRLSIAIAHVESPGRVSLFDAPEPGKQRVYFVRAPLPGRPNRVVLSTDPVNVVHAIRYGAHVRI